MSRNFAAATNLKLRFFVLTGYIISSFPRWKLGNMLSSFFLIKYFLKCAIEKIYEFSRHMVEQ